MNIETAPQFAAVYAEAAIAWLETGMPQAMLWHEDEGRWDFAPTDEELPPSQVAFVLHEGWDGQLSLDATTDIDSDHYDSRALRDEIERQMDEEGVARALIEALNEHETRRREAAEDGEPEESAQEQSTGDEDA